MSNVKLMTGRNLRFALVSYGRIAQYHFEAIERLAEHCELVDISDSGTQVRQNAAEITDANAHSSLDGILEPTTAGCVTRTMPNGFQSLQAITVVISVRHLVTEKPMAIRWKDASRMMGACDRADVYLLVVKPNRRNAMLQHLMHAIERGWLGRVHRVAVNVLRARPQEYYCSAYAAGAWTGRVAHLAGVGRHCRHVPFQVLYHRLVALVAQRVRGSISPGTGPGLGVPQYPCHTRRRPRPHGHAAMRGAARQARLLRLGSRAAHLDRRPLQRTHRRSRHRMHTTAHRSHQCPRAIQRHGR